MTAWFRRLLFVAAVSGLASCAPSHVSPSVAAPSSDGATASYVATVNTDVNALDVDLYKKVTCKTRDACIAQLEDVRSLTNALLQYLTATSPPSALAAPAARLELAARQFMDEVDIALSAMRLADSDYLVAASGPNVHDLDLAAGGIVCWPARPVPVEGGESPAGYECH